MPCEEVGAGRVIPERSWSEERGNPEEDRESAGR